MKFYSYLVLIYILRHPRRLLYVRKISCLVKLRLSECKNAIQSYKRSLSFAVYFADTSYKITSKNLLCVVWVCQVLKKKEKNQQTFLLHFKIWLLKEGTTSKPPELLMSYAKFLSFLLNLLNEIHYCKYLSC